MDKLNAGEAISWFINVKVCVGESFWRKLMGILNYAKALESISQLECWETETLRNWLIVIRVNFSFILDVEKNYIRYTNLLSCLGKYMQKS